MLDAQLRADSGLTHFEYFVLAMLSEAPERTLRMTALAQRTNATLPRLSHVVSRLEDRGLVERFPCPEDGRATNARLTRPGWDAVVAAAPGHVDDRAPPRPRPAHPHAAQAVAASATRWSRDRAGRAADRSGPDRRGLRG